MKIAIVIPYSLDQPGGVATHALGLGRWLRGEGHRVVVIAPGHSQIDRGVPVLSVGGSLGCTFNGSTAHLAVRPSQIRAARRAVADADIVHVHEPLTPGMAFGVARSARHLVVTHHAAYDATWLRLPLRMRTAWLPRRVSIAVSDAAADTAEAATGRRPTVIPNAIDLVPAPGQRPANATVAFIGRADDRRKGYGLFTEVAARVPEATFVAAGPGTSDTVHARGLGEIDDDALKGLLSDAQILLAPNLFGESFGITLVEAMAHGAAVVASDLPPFRAVCDNPAVATFFPVGDAAAAAAQVRSRLRDPIDPLVAHRAAEEFTWPMVGPRILECYRLAAPGLRLR